MVFWNSITDFWRKKTFLHICWIGRFSCTLVLSCQVYSNSALKFCILEVVCKSDSKQVHSLSLLEGLGQKVKLISLLPVPRSFQHRLWLCQYLLLSEVSNAVKTRSLSRPFLKHRPAQITNNLFTSLVSELRINTKC